MFLIWYGLWFRYGLRMFEIWFIIWFWHMVWERSNFPWGSGGFAWKKESETAIWQVFGRFLEGFHCFDMMSIWFWYGVGVGMVLILFCYDSDMFWHGFKTFPKNPTKPQTYRNHSFDPQKNHDFNPYDDVKITIEIETISTSWLQNQATTTINHTVSEYIWIISKSFKEILFENPPSRQLIY